MAEYMSKEVFLSSMGLTGDETKYGNRDAEHQHRSYSTYMSYEIMDSVDDSVVEEELAPVRHGRWDNIPNTYMCVSGKDGSYHGCATSCSVCHEINPNAYKTNHCPNCGAKMDLGVTNDA